MSFSLDIHGQVGMEGRLASLRPSLRSCLAEYGAPLFPPRADDSSAGECSMHRGDALGDATAAISAGHHYQGGASPLDIHASRVMEAGSARGGATDDGPTCKSDGGLLRLLREHPWPPGLGPAASASPSAPAPGIAAAFAGPLAGDSGVSSLAAPAGVSVHGSPSEDSKWGAPAPDGGAARSAGAAGGQAAAASAQEDGGNSSGDWTGERDAATQAVPPKHGLSKQSARSVSASSRLPPPFNEGSIGHPELCAKPCMFFASGVCSRSDSCGFCHFPHTGRPGHLDKRNRARLENLDPQSRAELLLPLIQSKLKAINDTQESRLLFHDLVAACGVDPLPGEPEETFDVQLPKLKSDRVIRSLLRNMSFGALMSMLLKIVGKDIPEVTMAGLVLWSFCRSVSSSVTITL